MPPPFSHPAFVLRVLANNFAVTQLKPGDALPEKYVRALMEPVGVGESQRFLAVTRTGEEVSVVEEEEGGDAGGQGAGWKCIKIAGPMEFDIVGVICNFTSPLKEAGIGVFVVSTWNTDYVLVPREKVNAAVEALKKDGWTFDE
ncbi:hypothetical protein BDW22DRAFT_1424472 [Trametopsis cervina]|nr:hypothetical protein BDW22DRAFT_1424472 [Trametopsis cervina]